MFKFIRSRILITDIHNLYRPVSISGNSQLFGIHSFSCERRYAVIQPGRPQGPQSYLENTWQEPQDILLSHTSLPSGLNKPSTRGIHSQYISRMRLLTSLDTRIRKFFFKKHAACPLALNNPKATVNKLRITEGALEVFFGFSANFACDEPLCPVLWIDWTFSPLSSGHALSSVQSSGPG